MSDASSGIYSKWLPLSAMSLSCALAAVARPLWSGAQLAAGDLIRLFYPSWSLMHGRWPVLEAPATNPFAGLRTPFTVNPESWIHYPPAWLIAVLPPPQLLLVLAALHPLVAALGCYAMLRAWRIRPMIALAVSPMWAASPWLLAHQMHPSFAATLAWAPWVAASVFQILRGSSQRRHVVVLALGAALSLLAGSPDVVLLLALGLAPFFLAALREAPRPRTRRIVRVALALTVGALLAAPMWLPAVLYAPSSIRALMLVKIFPLLPGSMLQLVNPMWGLQVAGSEQLAHIGLLPLLLLPLLFVRASPRQAFASVMMAAGLLLALVPLAIGPLNRIPARMTLVSVLAAVFAAAAGLENIRARESSAIRAALLTGFFLLAAPLVVTSVMDSGLHQRLEAMGAVVSICLLLVLLFASLRFQRRPRLAAAAVLIASLSQGAWTAWALAPVVDSNLYEKISALGSQAPWPNGRILDAVPGSPLLNWGAVWRARTVRATGTLLSADAWRAIDARDTRSTPNLKLAANVLYIEQPHNPRWQELGVQSVLVPSTSLPTSAAPALRYADSNIALVDLPWQATDAWFDGGRVRVEHGGDDEMRYFVDGKGGRLITTEVLRYGLDVTIDGSLAPYELDKDRIAVKVPAGKHEVLLRWSTPGRRAGYALALAGLLLLLALCARARQAKWVEWPASK